MARQLHPRAIVTSVTTPRLSEKFAPFLHCSVLRIVLWGEAPGNYPGIVNFIASQWNHHPFLICDLSTAIQRLLNFETLLLLKRQNRLR